MVNSSDKVYEALESWAKKLEDPDIAKEFEGFNKIVQFYFTDIDEKMYMDFRNNECTIFEGLKVEAELFLETTSDIIFGLKEGTIDVMEAFISGKLSPHGNVEDFQKLRDLL
ncbi:MAG: SCP2 sterol-binding domain-containing protein [Candidatus Helarchaeota archaeon]